jgi:hypothetical protein
VTSSPRSQPRHSRAWQFKRPLQVLWCCTLLTAWANTAQSAPPLPPVLDVEDEPNNDLEHATWVTLPLIDGHACLEPAGDIDVYQFDLAHPGPLYAGAKSASLGGETFVPPSVTGFALTLLSDDGRVRAEGLESLDVAHLTAGHYYLKITRQTAGCYDLHLYSDARPPPTP